MSNSKRPIRGIMIAFVIAAGLIAAMMYSFSNSIGAPDDEPLRGVDMPEPSENG